MYAIQLGWAGDDPSETTVRLAVAVNAALWRLWSGLPVPEPILAVVAGIGDGPAGDPMRLYAAVAGWAEDYRHANPADSLTVLAYVAVMVTARVWCHWLEGPLPAELRWALDDYTYDLLDRILEGTDR